MIQFFPDLPNGVRLSFCFGVNEVIKDGKKYVFIGQNPNEPARYEVTDELVDSGVAESRSSGPAGPSPGFCE